MKFVSFKILFFLLSMYSLSPTCWAQDSKQLSVPNDFNSNGTTVIFQLKSFPKNLTTEAVEKRTALYPPRQRRQIKKVVARNTPKLKKLIAKVNKTLRDQVAAEFSGEHLFLTDEEANSSYTDIENYRYVFNIIQDVTVSENANGQASAQTKYSIEIFDRKTSRTFTPEKKCYSLKKCIRINLRKMEELNSKS